MFQQRISAPPGQSRPAEDEEIFPQVLPRWDSITAAPEKSAGSRLPPPSSAVHHESREDLDEDLDDDFDDDFDDDDDDENEHSYTWLHYLILVALAFVLGLIIWKVGIEGRSSASATGSATGTSVVQEIDHPGSDPYL